MLTSKCLAYRRNAFLTEILGLNYRSRWLNSPIDLRSIPDFYTSEDTIKLKQTLHHGHTIDSQRIENLFAIQRSDEVALALSCILAMTNLNEWYLGDIFMTTSKIFPKFEHQIQDKYMKVFGVTFEECEMIDLDPRLIRRAVFNVSRGDTSVETKRQLWSQAFVKNEPEDLVRIFNDFRQLLNINFPESIVEICPGESTHSVKLSHDKDLHRFFRNYYFFNDIITANKFGVVCIYQGVVLDVKFI